MGDPVKVLLDTGNSIHIIFLSYSGLVILYTLLFGCVLLVTFALVVKFLRQNHLRYKGKCSIVDDDNISMIKNIN